MRILLVHNYYQQKGGEEGVFSAEADLLQTHGIEVIKYTVHNNCIKGILDKLNVLKNVTYSQASYHKFILILAQYKPDLVHVHNFFPLLTPSIYTACQQKNIPIVQTLHNYRIICANALLLRDGQVCELCLSGNYKHAVKYKCYKQSLLGSYAVAKMIEYHQQHETWKNQVDIMIALTQFAKDKFISAGIPAEKIKVKPNFCQEVKLKTPPNEKRSYILYVGRISPEKGVDLLIQAWKHIDYPLKIAGSGPELEKLNAINKNTLVDFIGDVSHTQIETLMQNALFMVMPSVWYEGFGLVLVEALACGLPIICSDLGSMAEIVNDGVEGVHFKVGNVSDLTQKIKWLLEHDQQREEMGIAARKTYLQHYTPQQNFKILMDIYQQVIH